MEKVVFVDGADFHYNLTNFLKLCTTADLRHRKFLRADVLVGRSLFETPESFEQCIREPLLASSLHKELIWCHAITDSVFRMSSRESTAPDLKTENFQALSTDIFAAPSTKSCLPSSQAALGAIFDAFQEKIILARGASTLPAPADYFRNLSIPKMESKLAATETTSLISPLLHRHVDVMPGINQSMYYLAKAGSYCEMHCEDGDLPSLNLLRCLIPDGHPFALNRACEMTISDDRDAGAGQNSQTGGQRIGKIWLFVHEKDRMLTALADEVSQLHRSCGNTAQEECIHFNHKNILITRAFLQKYQLHYSLVGQAPGDIIFIKSGIFHQVINIDHCFNEAINYGTPTWNLHADFTHLCRCPQEKISCIAKNPQILVVTKSAKVQVYDCPVDGCPAQFCLQRNLDQHMVEAHQHRFSCTVCHQQYRSRLILKRHTCKNPDGTAAPAPTRRTCKACSITVSDWSAHRRTQKHRTNMQKRVADTEATDAAAPFDDPMLADHMPLLKRLKYSHVCPECTRCFTTQSNLNKHVHTRHRDASTATEQAHGSTVKKSCPSCDQEFSVCALPQHLKSCNKYRCRVCPMSFSVKKHFQFHTKYCKA